MERQTRLPLRLLSLQPPLISLTELTSEDIRFNIFRRTLLSTKQKKKKKITMSNRIRAVNWEYLELVIAGWNAKSSAILQE